MVYLILVHLPEGILAGPVLIVEISDYICLLYLQNVSYHVHGGEQKFTCDYWKRTWIPQGFWPKRMAIWSTQTIDPVDLLWGSSPHFFKVHGKVSCPLYLLSRNGGNVFLLKYRMIILILFKLHRVPKKYLTFLTRKTQNSSLKIKTRVVQWGGRKKGWRLGRKNST